MSSRFTNPGPNAGPDPWLVIPRPQPNATLRLFCLPYAGGSALLYRQWPAGLPANIELCAVQLPGRGSRLSETPFTALSDLIPVLAARLRPYLDKPCVLFGHSMGAVIAFELARVWRREAYAPLGLCVSGRRAPQLPGVDKPTYALPEPEFIEMLRRLNGTPREVLENVEMMRLMLPLLRADFQLIQTYQYHDEAPLTCPLMAFGGVEDADATPAQVAAWRVQTSRAFVQHTLPGGHFFLHTEQPLLLRWLAQELYQIGRTLG